jgi:hypothetical protein
MAIAMQMEWPGITPEQYEDVRRRVDWETHVPRGAIFHAARFTDDGLTVGDVWETEADFNRFVEERLMPVVREVGIEGEPTVRFAELYTYFNAEAAHVAA